MSGHNKWSKVKHKKEAEDKKKSKIFTMHARLITIESKKCGGDTSSPGLKNAIIRARVVNMPSGNIDRAVTRGTGAEGGTLEEVVYEAYGPGGTAIIITGITDSKNRTLSEIKRICADARGNVATPGSALWAFKKDGDEFLPENIVRLSEEDTTALRTLVENLLDNDDVRAVFTNATP